MTEFHIVEKVRITIEADTADEALANYLTHGYDYDKYVTVEQRVVLDKNHNEVPTKES